MFAFLLASLSLANGPHADFLSEARAGRAPALVRTPMTALPPVTPGPDVVVYGYQAYWADDLDAVPWDDLSHLAIFNAGVDTAGNLFDTHHWDDTALAVSMAAPYGVRVHLCVTNFDTGELEVLLGDSGARQTLIDNLVVWQGNTGAHGVNIDFEGLPSSRRDEMVQFISDLEAAVGEVAIATPAVDWSGAWDYGALSQDAHLFIMGYGYHWSGSSESGPTDPLHSGSGTIWGGSHSLAWTVEDYLAKGADPARVVLGLPLYGRAYPTGTETIPTSNLGTGASVTYSVAAGEVDSFGARYEETSHSPWYYDGYTQIWYPDAASVLERIDHALAAGIGGFGFWALHYDDNDPALWSGIHDRTVSAGTGTGTTGTGTGTGTDGTVRVDLIADAGPAFTAFVGDVVVLSGEGSRGPEGAELSFQWTQTFGPPVTLISPDSATPSFEVVDAGTHIFELVVSDGDGVSAPDEAVMDAAERGCGCDQAPGWTLGWLPLLLLIRRR